MQNLVPNERLGAQGYDEIRNHPFFKGFDWSRLRRMPAPKLHKVQNECTDPTAVVVLYSWFDVPVLHFLVSLVEVTIERMWMIIGAWHGEPDFCRP